jgi:hypothetical protein
MPRSSPSRPRPKSGDVTFTSFFEVPTALSISSLGPSVHVCPAEI